MGIEVEDEQGTRSRCKVRSGTTARVDCDFTGSGRYRVLLFHSDTPRGRYQYDGQLLVNVP